MSERDRQGRSVSVEVRWRREMVRKVVKQYLDLEIPSVRMTCRAMMATGQVEIHSGFSDQCPACLFQVSLVVRHANDERVAAEVM